MGKRTAISVLLFLIGFITTSFAIEDPLPAPVPAQIRSAKKIFVANGGNFVTDWAKLPRDLAYDAYYSGMKDWGHFELVSSPADADLVFRIEFLEVPGNPIVPMTRQLRLLIIEPKTNVVLWGMAENCGQSSVDMGKRRDLTTGMAALLSDLKSIVTGVPEAKKPAKKENKPSWF